MYDIVDLTDTPVRRSMCVCTGGEVTACALADGCCDPVILYCQSSVTTQMEGHTGNAPVNEWLHADDFVCFVVFEGFAVYPNGNGVIASTAPSLFKSMLVAFLDR